MRSRKASSGLRVGVISQSVPSVLGVHSWFKLNMPLGTSKNAMRIGFAASTANAGVIASNMGRASVAPAPRRNVRRGMDFLRITIFHSPHLEWGAVDDTKNLRRPFLVVRRRITHDFANNGVIVLFDATAERIGQQALGEILHEHVVLLHQNLPQAGRTVECRTIGEGSGRIDRRRTGSGSVAPTADAVEIVQCEAER